MTWESLGWSSLGVLCIINLMMTGFLWQQSRRGPKRRFLRKLLDGKPIVPKHKPPRRPEGEEGLESFITDADRQFFADFARFAEILNHWIAIESGREPWRVQELPDPELSRGLLGRSDGPSYGRRYEVFYHQVRIGHLEIQAHGEYSPTAPKVFTAMALSYARLLPFRQIDLLISWIAALTTSASSYADERRDLELAVHAAMLDQLWQYDRDLDARSSGGFFQIRFSGTADRRTLLWMEQQQGT